VIEQYPDIVANLKILGEEAREDMGDAIMGRKGKNSRDCGWADQPE